jgi:WG repeat protein
MILIAASIGAGAQTANEPPELLPIVQYGKFGYINRSAKVVIPPKFVQAWDFSEGLAVVTVFVPDHLYPFAGVIDTSGAWVTEPTFMKIGTFHEGHARAELHDQYGTRVLLSKSGETVKVPSADITADSMQIGEVSEGLVSFSPTGDKFGFMDTVGSLAVPVIYASVRPFHEGLAKVCQEKCGYVDVHGKVVIPLTYTAGPDFESGKARVCEGSKCGYVTKNGVFTQSSEVFMLAHLFGQHIVEYNADGLHVLHKDGLVGFVDDHDKVAIKAQFKEGDEFSEGLAAVIVDEYGTCGYVDKTGKMAIPAIFDGCDKFTGGLAPIDRFDANQGTSIGYIDKKGHVLWLSTATGLQLPHPVTPKIK